MTKDHLTLHKPGEPIDPHARIAAYGMPAGVNGATPAVVNIGKPVLLAVLEDNLAAVRANRVLLKDTATQLEAEAITGQLEGFLAWAQKYPYHNIYVALHPQDPTE